MQGLYAIANRHFWITFCLSPIYVLCECNFIVINSYLFGDMLPYNSIEPKKVATKKTSSMYMWLQVNTQ